MCASALLDLGLSIRTLKKELSKLELSKEYHLHVGRGLQQQISGLAFQVHTHHTSSSHRHFHANSKKQKHIHGRTFSNIRRLINGSKLSPFVRKHALSLFGRIAAVEGKIHGMSAEQVHFHEIGAIDSIVDIVSVCILIEALNLQQILASAPCEGHGFVECAHGRFPVPSTATLELLKGIPMRQIDIPSELITPTGAAILAEFVDAFVPMPEMIPMRIGYGLGSKIFPKHPNVLRAILADTTKSPSPQNQNPVDVLETQVDDITPELLAHAMDRILKEGALDVTLAPLYMKKGRLGTGITVLSKPEDTPRLADLLFVETGSFGLRLRRSERICLDREIRKIKTALGSVEIKVGLRNGKVISAKPELESCRRLALQRNKPLRTIWQYAIATCSKLLNL